MAFLMLAARTIRLGDEYDARLRGALMQVLREMGGLVGERTWSVGGSQEVEVVAVAIGGRPLTIEAETYAGLTITGEPTLVEDLAKRIEERLVDA